MDLQEIREQIQQIRTLIRGGKVSEAVASLDGLSQSIRDPNLRDEIIALSSNHRRLENDARQGVLDGHDLNLRQNRLIQQSLSLLTLLEKEFAGQREQVNTIQRELKQQKKKNNLLLIILPLLLLVFIVGGIWLFKPSPPPATSDCERFLREGFAAFENSKYTLAKDALINAKYFCGEERNELKIARVDQLLAAVAEKTKKDEPQPAPEGSIGVTLITPMLRLVKEPTQATTSGRVVYPNKWYYITSGVNPRLHLDVKGGSKAAKTPVWLYQRNLTAAQQWIFIPSNEKHYYYIKSKVSDLYLDVEGGLKTSKAKIWQHPLNRTDAQKWEFLQNNSTESFCYIRSKVSKHYLTVDKDGRTIIQMPFAQSNNQRWRLMPIENIRDHRK